LVRDSFQDLCVEKNGEVFYLVNVYSACSIARTRKRWSNGPKEWKWKMRVVSFLEKSFVKKDLL